MNMKIKKSNWNDVAVAIPAKNAPVLVAWSALTDAEDFIDSRGVCVAVFDGGTWKGLPKIKECTVVADFWAPLALHPQDFGT